ncbi:MAG: hypothetical protein H6672_02475 [Anaerolineaceae bacterium]|nr:hypothetical protein [Anaerolineaceae bacterium]
MELILVLRILLRRWVLVLIPALVAAVIVLPDLLNGAETVSGGFTVTLRYSAAQELDAIPNRDGDYQDVWLASEFTVNAFTDWVRTSSFVNEIMQTTTAQNVEVNPGLLGVAADNSHSVGVLTMSYPDAATLEAIAQAAITVLQSRAQAYFPQLGAQPAQVTVLDTPQVVAAPPPIGNRLAPFIRIGVGLFFGVALAFLVEYLDPTLRRREQVEQLGLPVIAALPKE